MKYGKLERDPIPNRLESVMTEQVKVRNLETGDVGLIRRDWFENPAINNGILIEVEPSAKPAAKKLWKSKMPAIAETVAPKTPETPETPTPEED